MVFFLGPGVALGGLSGVQPGVAEVDLVVDTLAVVSVVLTIAGSALMVLFLWSGRDLLLGKRAWWGDRDPQYK